MGDRLGRCNAAWGLDGRPTASPALTHAAWQAGARRRGDGDPVLYPHRSHGPGDGALPAAGPLIGLSPDPRTVRSLALSWGVDPIQVDMYTTTDEMVWFAVETAFNHGLVAAATPCSCWPVRPTAAGAPPPTCCGSCHRVSAGTATGSLVRRAGHGDPLARAGPRVDGPLGGAARLSRRLDDESE